MYRKQRLMSRRQYQKEKRRRSFLKLKTNGMLDEFEISSKIKIDWLVKSLKMDLNVKKHEPLFIQNTIIHSYVINKKEYVTNLEIGDLLDIFCSKIYTVSLKGGSGKKSIVWKKFKGKRESFLINENALIGMEFFKQCGDEYRFWKEHIGSHAEIDKENKIVIKQKRYTTECKISSGIYKVGNGILRLLTEDWLKTERELQSYCLKYELCLFKKNFELYDENDMKEDIVIYREYDLNYAVRKKLLKNKKKDLSWKNLLKNKNQDLSWKKYLYSLKDLIIEENFNEKDKKSIIKISTYYQAIYSRCLQ